MRTFFSEGFRDKGRNEPDAEFALRQKALQEALDRVAAGTLDKSFATSGDGSKVLLQLRKATQGAGVQAVLHFVFCL